MAAASSNLRLQDKAIDRAVDLRHYANGVLRRMMATLNRADAALMARLAEALMRLSPESFTVERLESLLASVREVNHKAYDAVFTELDGEVRGLAGLEARQQTAMLRGAVPAPVAAHFPIAAVSAEQVYAAALARPFQGRLLKDWAANVEASRMRTIREAVRQGFVQGQTASEIVRKIRGGRANNYADGLLERPRRELAAVVQTALSHTAQTARRELYNQNADLVKAVQWVSTLDNKTTHECAIRDGLQYTTEGEPIGHSIPWGDGPGRLHFNCRSVDVPVLKSWRELGIPVDELSPAERASMDGTVPADTTFGEWFGKQSAERQDEIVGERRGEMFRDGEVSFEKFYDDRGRWLSLAQLEARTE